MASRAIVAGAAGGIGAAIVRGFLERGLEVYGLDTSDDVLRMPGVDGRLADVLKIAEIGAALAAAPACEFAHHVVGVVGRMLPEEHAGILQRPILESSKIFADSVALNLEAQFNLIRAVLPLLRAAEGNRSITFISSVNGLAPFGGIAYSAAKAGLAGLMFGLLATDECAGVRINVVAPGTVDTPLTRLEASEAGDARRFERAASQTIVGRVGYPEDIARVVVALATDFTHVTGETIRVDGGQTIARH